MKRSILNLFCVLALAGCGDAKTTSVMNGATVYVNSSGTGTATCDNFDDILSGGGCHCPTASHHVRTAQPSTTSYTCSCTDSGGTIQASTAYAVCISATKVSVAGAE